MTYIVPSPGRDPNLDTARLKTDGMYFAEMLEKYSKDPQWNWYVAPHKHLCQTCRRWIKHTGLEAMRDGDVISHTCCGKDVRYVPAKVKE